MKFYLHDGALYRNDGRLPPGGKHLSLDEAIVWTLNFLKDSSKRSDSNKKGCQSLINEYLKYSGFDVT